ncbi:MAG TPA: TIGR00730 family Rossman fold protein [Acidimicrobiales bacterium]|nr:TIGR00730 family Rossman fold protein [Acidimicrobiales bacterium]
MAERLPRYRTNNSEVDRKLVELLDAVGATDNRDQLFEILTSGLLLATDRADRLDLKITNAALKEMRNAFNVFGPYREVPKVTMFGSARTLPDDPLYSQARDLAAAMADRGWMVVTGAGPGIMAAGLEGAGRDKSFGINIRLPFEQSANEFILGDPKLVEMKYFFTRKLMLMKESDGFVCLPGGFGTLDETLELLTLVQTGKALPAPIVLLEVPQGTYWKAWADFLENEVAPRGLISPDDSVLYRITDDVREATDEIINFYRNYHSIRYVGDLLVIRLRAQPTPDEVAELDREFSAICVEGGIQAIGPTPPELHGNDHPELARLALRFDRVHHGRLRQLIDAINRLPSAPPVATTPPRKQEQAAAQEAEAEAAAAEAAEV